jgi:hypothetical protein
VQLSKPKIAIFAGATATVLNTEPLVTSNKARVQYGLPPRVERDGSTPRFDVLRPQRLAAPVTVLIEQHSAHPLEGDAAELYAPPDGYVDADGQFGAERRATSDVPVYRITLEPEDGLFPCRTWPARQRASHGRATKERPVVASRSTRTARAWSRRSIGSA